MIEPDFSTATWRKSSRSGTSNGGGGTQCVEVALNGPVVGVRQSKNPSTHLVFTAAMFAQFRDGLKRPHS